MTQRRRAAHPYVPPCSDDDMIEGQKVAEAMAEQFPHEMNSHKGRLFRLLVVMVAGVARDIRLNGETRKP